MTQLCPTWFKLSQKNKCTNPKAFRIQEVPMNSNWRSTAHDFPDDLIKLISLFVEDVTEHLPTSLKDTKPEQWHSLAETRFCSLQMVLLMLKEYESRYFNNLTLAIWNPSKAKTSNSSTCWQMEDLNSLEILILKKSSCSAVSYRQPLIQKKTMKRRNNHRALATVIIKHTVTFNTLLSHHSDKNDKDTKKASFVTELTFLVFLAISWKSDLMINQFSMVHFCGTIPTSTH